MRTALCSALALAAACSGAAPASGPAAPHPTDAAPRRAALDAVLQRQWEYRLAHEPELATSVGDPRYNDRWSDYSAPAIAADLDQARAFLDELRAIDPAGLPEQDVLNHRLMVRELQRRLDEARFEGWLMPIDQFTGIQIALPQMVSVQPFATVADYEHYVARLDALPTVLAQAIALAKDGQAKGLIPPRFILERVVGQGEKLAAGPAAQSPFAQPVERFPDAIPAAEQKRLRAAVLASIEQRVLPAYAAFTTFVRRDYAPKGRTEVGAWALPDGDARYAAAVKFYTTTDLSADEIHELGLREVARIEAEATAIARRLGFAELASLQASIRADEKLHATSREDILGRYQTLTDAMYRELPRLFGRLPQQKMGIQPTEPYREKEAPGAEYILGTPDGSRAAVVRVNTADPTHRVLTGVETTAYHEGVPGHHLQIAIAQEVPGLARFRQFAYYGAFIEGWALYAEHLAKEVGFYRDPYSEYGHLEAELMRAIRLVVDTGLHHKKWSRDQVVAYFRAHSALDEPTIQNETDRYIVLPGQALSYKVGQLTILRLRQKAQDALGAAFDLRGFHDEVLGGGALPLDVLEERIDAWVARRKAAR